MSQLYEALVAMFACAHPDQQQEFISAHLNDFVEYVSNERKRSDMATFKDNLHILGSICNTYLKDIPDMDYKNDIKQYILAAAREPTMMLGHVVCHISPVGDADGAIRKVFDEYFARIGINGRLSIC